MDPARDDATVATRAMYSVTKNPASLPGLLPLPSPSCCGQPNERAAVTRHEPYLYSALHSAGPNAKCELPDVRIGKCPIALSLERILLLACYVHGRSESDVVGPVGTVTISS